MCMVETLPHITSHIVCKECDGTNVVVFTAKHPLCSFQVNQNCLGVIANISLSSSAFFSLLYFLLSVLVLFVLNLYGRGMVHIPQVIRKNEWVIIVNLYLTGEMLQVSLIS